LLFLKLFFLQQAKNLAESFPWQGKFVQVVALYCVIALVLFFAVATVRSVIASIVPIDPSIRRAVKITYFSMVITMRAVSALPIVILGRKLRDTIKKFDSSATDRKIFLLKASFIPLPAL
jgi:hypothetical protein